MPRGHLVLRLIERAMLPAFIALTLLLAYVAPSTTPRAQRDASIPAAAARTHVSSESNTAAALLGAPAPALSQSAPVEVGGLTAYLEAVASWKIPPRQPGPQAETRKKVKFVLANSRQSALWVAQTGLRGVALTRMDGSRVERLGAGAIHSTRAVPLELAAGAEEIVTLRARLYWYDGRLCLDVTDSMARTWTFPDLSPGSYELRANYTPGRPYTLRPATDAVRTWVPAALWAQSLETAPLKFRLEANPSDELPQENEF